VDGSKAEVAVKTIVAAEDAGPGIWMSQTARSVSMLGKI
jgi:hypothetical protein